VIHLILGGRGGSEGRGGYQSRGGGGRNRGGGRGDGGRGRGRGPDLSDLNKVLTNNIPVELGKNFSFYLYSVQCHDKDGKEVEQRHVRFNLFNIGVWDDLLVDMPREEKEDLKRVVFFQGSFFFAGRAIPGLERENLPVELSRGNDTEGNTMTVVGVQHFGPPQEVASSAPQGTARDELTVDTFRCQQCNRTFSAEYHMKQHCSQTGHSPVYTPVRLDGPGNVPEFMAYLNVALQRAMKERLNQWGDAFIDPNAQNATEAKDRQGNYLGVRIYEAFFASFDLTRSPQAHKANLVLTVDLRAKILRTVTLYDVLKDVPRNKQVAAKKTWIGQRVMYNREKKGYDLVDLDFEHSPRTLPIPGKDISHFEYFARKGITLQYPDASPMIVLNGRKNQRIFLPPELVSGTELEPRVREMLPQIASYGPEKRYGAIQKMKEFLKPGAQTTRRREGLLPALGIILKEGRDVVRARVLRVPEMIAAGVPIPKDKGEMWAPFVSKANFKVEPTRATVFNVVVVHNRRVTQRDANKVYVNIKNLVNSFKAPFRFGDNKPTFVEAGDGAQHSGAIERHFSGQMPPNLFVLDFLKPAGKTDPEYSVVKMVLARGGYLSQFVNFKTYAHDDPRDERKSTIILQGVARQVLQKAGVQLWWVKIPRSLKLPAIFVGADVFHSPFAYNPNTKKRERKKSCAAIVVQIIREYDRCDRVEIYSKTHQRDGGQEFNLGDVFKSTIQEALRTFKVNPASAIVWRDGIDDASLSTIALAEARGVREGLEGVVTGQAKSRASTSLAYIVAQKRIANKFFAVKPGYGDGDLGAPPGTLVEDMQRMEKTTFYINGRAPPYSTSKPVRYVVVQKDEGIAVPIPQLTWEQCFAYPNWTGPIKVPNVLMLSHKLAELAGGFRDSGNTINTRLATKLHYL